MPRKNKTPASSLLNRENQRRSRTRRREFVEDLQRRLLEYERRGVQATLEMQKVAQAVAAENADLRALLAARGVSRDEIEAHITSPEPASDASFSCPSQHDSQMAGELRLSRTPAAECPRRAEPGAGSRNEALERTTGRGSALPASFEPTPSPSPAALSEPSLRMTLRTLSSPVSSACDGAVAASGHARATSPRQEPGQPQPQPDWHTLRDRATDVSCACSGELDVNGAAPYMPPIDPACYCPPELPSRPSGPSTATLETPCEEAAAILAQLRGHANSMLAREALGCPSASNCVVKNTDLLQLMDEIA